MIKTKKKMLPIGLSNFQEMIERDYYYVDKSLFIKELAEDGSKILVMPRPRRFGKTLNLSMLKYFFRKDDESKKYLFKNLKISKEKEIMELQGKYPVITFSFKDIKEMDWESCISKIKTLISSEYYNHEYLLESNLLGELEKIKYKKILMEEGSKADYENSLGKLMEYLYKYHNEKIIVLIDEYDMSIQAGYINGYYEKVVNFMRNFLSSGLKDNDYLEKSVLTGILRISKESIFSGLNNLEVCSLLGKKYSKWFGLEEKEVEDILEYFEIKEELENVKDWYNGYIFGGRVTYNPWSIINFVKSDLLQPYWVNTSSNDIIKRLLTHAGEGIKKGMETLLKGGVIRKSIYENIVFNEIENTEDTIWSFLLFSGYLKADNIKYDVTQMDLIGDLSIPNIEIKTLYNKIISNWFDENMSGQDEKYMLKSLIEGELDIFEEIFCDYVENAFSYFDVGESESEKFYHAFVLGLMIKLRDSYIIKSNRESGYGRYDVMLIPKDKNKRGIIFEFKKKRKKESLDEALKLALDQIEEKRYSKDLEEMGIKEIKKIGIVFDGKTVKMKEGK
ncbi:MAG: AAA family ATPase [Fusobacteriota bacterium]